MMHDYFVAPTEKFAVPVLEQLGYQDDPVQSAMIKGKYPMLPKPNAEYLASWEKAIIKA